jgi:ABC-type amino acid transport substrate-binding protein
MVFRLLLALLLFTLTGCDSWSSHKRHFISRDPTWFPVDLGPQTPNINAFTNALIEAVNKEQKMNLILIDTSWSDLLLSVDHKKVSGALSSLSALEKNKDRYDFSDPFLQLGPVLVVRASNPKRSLEEFSSGVLGYYQYDESIFIAQKQVQFLLEPYQNFALALENVANGHFDALLMPSLDANALVPHLYPSLLKIASEPLNDKGFRLISLKSSHKSLIENFNLGLKKIKSNGTYSRLRSEYGVY